MRDDIAVGEMNLGPAVIGEQRFAQVQRHATETVLGNLGPLVTGETSPTALAPEDEAVSIRTLREMLREAPARVDAMFEAEQKRPDPRRSAMKELLLAEHRRPKGPRPAMLAKLDAALAVFETAAATTEPEPDADEDEAALDPLDDTLPEISGLDPDEEG